MQTFRRIVFWVFVATYLTVCPLTVLYALGYWFQPGLEGGLVKTGLISLATEPPGASVYLGNQRYTQKTPTVLRDLLPGDYPVKLVLKDRQPWARTVSVEAEKATVLERVLLLPRALSPHVLLPGPFEKLTPVPGTHLVLLAAGHRILDVTVYDVRDEVSWPLLPTGSPFRMARIRSWTMVPGSESLLLRLHTSDGERVERVALKPNDERVDHLTGLFPKPSSLAAWDPLETRWLFALADRALHRLDRKGTAIYPHIAERVLGFGLFEKTLYVLKDDGTVARLTLEGKRLKAPEGDLRIPRDALEVKPPVQLTVLSPKVLLALGERGELLANRFPYRLAEKGVLGIEPDAARQRALVWRKDALGMVRLVDDALILQWVFTRGNRIEQAFWAYEDSHALFRDGDRVFLLEMETSGTPEPRELLHLARRSPVVYTEDTGLLYYLNDDGALAWCELLPQRKIIPQAP